MHSDTNASKNWVIILSAGGGERFGKDKMLVKWQGKPLVCHSVATAKQVCQNVIVVASQSNAETLKQILDADVLLTIGGDTRSESVKNGLAKIPDDAQLVAIHDGARPFATVDLFKRAFELAQQKGSAVPTLPVTDTLYCHKTTEAPIPLDRNTISKAQTPQVFDFKKLAEAYQNNSNKTDDGQVWLNAYGSLALMEGETTNIKVTYPCDLPYTIRYKTGVGFDAHRLKEGRKLILCGVTIPFCKGLDGHSDADVAFHALCDAILSAIGERDIGNLFPDSDDKYFGIDSGILLDEVWQKATLKGFSLANASLVIMAQSPKLSPYVFEMRRNIARHLFADIRQINLSATTTENLGITAEGLGMACHANVLLQYDADN